MVPLSAHLVENFTSFFFYCYKCTTRRRHLPFTRHFFFFFSRTRSCVNKFISIFINFNDTLVSSTHTLPVNVFNLEEGETMLARGQRKFSCPRRESNSRPGFILPSTIHDWTVLKLTEKIIQRNVFNKRKRNPG